MKTKSLFSAILMFCMLTVLLPLRAQTYSSTIHRTINVHSADVNQTQRCGGGSTVLDFHFTELSATVRGVPQFSAYTNNIYVPAISSQSGASASSDDFRWDYTSFSQSTIGHAIYDYADLTSKLTIECMAGQEFFLSTKGSKMWSNAVLFVDWDGNGSFDDHDPELYNLYGVSNVCYGEYAGKEDGVVFKPSWDVLVPKTFTKEFTTRVRIRFDEAVMHEAKGISHALKQFSIPIWTTGLNSDGATPRITTATQKFYSTFLWRFMPSAQAYKGCTIDLALHIVPDPLTMADDGKTLQENEVVVGTGNIAPCAATTSGTAITNEAGFEAFLNATSGDYYLANDITISSTLDASASTFNGTFDGNGHTITINPSTASKNVNTLTRDECFYPYGLTDYSTFDAATVSTAIANNMMTQNVSPSWQPTTTNYPQKVIAGGFCGVLGKEGVIKNVKVVYSKDVIYSTYNGSNFGTLFGLVAGINKGTIENVSIDIPSGKTVNVGAVYSYTREPSALGGIAGVLYRGIVKNCAVNVDGTFRLCRATGATTVNTSGNVGQNSCMGGHIGRLQCGVVSNVNFSGAGAMYMGTTSNGYARYCMGGIAGMLYTPQGHFGGQTALQDLTWGYDNGTIHPDVNNVILSFSGTMGTETSSTFSDNNVFHRGLLFAEATDTVLVPNLITQYTAAPTAMANVSTAASLSGTFIPLISRAKGHTRGDGTVLNTGNYVGQIYLGVDARVAGNNTNVPGRWLNVSTVSNTKLDFAQVVDPTYCTTYSTPYVVATYTGIDPLVKGIEGQSSNVSWQEDIDGDPYVKIDTDPLTYTSSSWTWSHTASTPGGDGGGGSGASDFSCTEKTEEHGYCATPVTTGTPIASATDWNNIPDGATGSYYLTSDITITGFTKGQFAGSLYGNGHTITVSNFSTNLNTYDGKDYMGGLFSYITGAGTIQDLTVVYTTQKTAYTTSTNPLYCGLIAGASAANISNVRVLISTGTYIGVGNNSSASPDSHVGGILGTSALGGDLTNVTFEINGGASSRLLCGNAKCAAGIVGVTEDDNLNLSNAVVRGNGYIKTNRAGKVAGVTCPSTANVSLNGYVYALTNADAMQRDGSSSSIGRVFSDNTYTSTVVTGQEQVKFTPTSVNASVSAMSGYAMNNIIDYTSTTTMYRASSAQAAGQTIQINLGQEVDVKRIGVHFGAETTSGTIRYSYPSRYALEYSTDGTNWTTTVDNQAGANNTEQTFTRNITARYVRLRIVTARTGSRQYRLQVAQLWVEYMRDITSTSTAAVNTPSRYYLMDNAGAVPANDYNGGNYTSIPIYDKVVEIETSCHDEDVPAESPVTTYAGDYTHKTGTTTSSGRYISSLTVNGTTIDGLRSGAGDLYFDKRSSVISVVKGGTVSITAAGAGEWMHTFIYVDWNNDGDFTDGYTVITNGGSAISFTGNDGEWVYNNAVSGSQNVATSSSFTIPANQKCGVYNVRYKVDWASNDPTANNQTGSNSILTNGGEIIDFKIEVPCTPAGTVHVCNTSRTDINSSVQAYLKNGRLTLASCDIDALTTEQTFAAIYDDVSSIISGTADPTAEAHATGTAPTSATHLYLGVSDVPVGIKVIARCGSQGGGWVSTDMARTYAVEKTIEPYEGEMFTAVPDGPFSLDGWYLSTDNGTSFTKVGNYLDYTYTGSVDAILEARFTFTDYEGNFGTYKFTDATKVPYYIKEVSSTGGEINISPARASGFASYSWTGGEPRLRYLSDAYIGMKPTALLPSQTVTVTFSVANMNQFPSDARILAFLDYNNNRWFDFDANSSGKTEGLTPHKELVFVANGDGTVLLSKLGTPTRSVSGNTHTFTFQISNTMFPAGDLGTTRLRFYAGRYVDKYGLGPCNVYDNLAYRYDDAVSANDRITLNDDNGSVYTPNNQVNLNEYVNVVDVNTEIMAFIPYNATWEIQNGKNYVVRDLYIESAETDAGPQSGRITFNAAAPYGQLTVTGHIIVRKQLYKDRWHHVAFPTTMDGTSGSNGIRELNKTSGVDYKIDNSKWLMMTFNPVTRNVKDGYNSGRSTPATSAYLNANTFYWIAADPTAAATVHTDDLGAEYSWFDFYSKSTNFFFEPKRSGVITFDETYRVKSDALFTDQNVFAIYNPFFSAIDTRELKDQDAVGGWEEIKVWNTKLERWIGIDPTTNFSIYPFTGWWIHLTEKAVTSYDGTDYTINIGALQGGSDYAAADPHPDQTLPAPVRRRDRADAPAVEHEVVEIPDAYFVGLDRIANKNNMNYISNTQVLLTTDGTSASTGDRHDAPVSFANAQARIPEIWTVAGTSTRMMQNDLQRADRVEVPMGIRIKQAGEYIIKLKSSNVEASHVYLVDKENGAIVELKNAEQLLGGYEFLADAGDFDRFTLIIVNPKSETGLERVESDVQTLIYTTDDAVHFSNLPMGYTVGICDVVGRTLDSRLVNADQMELALPNNRGVYLINVRDQKGRVVETVKVVK